MDPGQYETPARRDLYEWCLSHPVSTSRGTPYPCDPYDLDECIFGSNRPPRSTHSCNSATANLENFLHPDAPIDSAVHAAVTRLREALRIHDWKPDLVIKAFTDLDTVFFGGKLRGHITIHWRRASWWMQHFRSPQGYHRCMGTTQYLDRQKAKIHLNAWRILLDTHYAKTAMWGVMLHEMIHAYGFVMCGLKRVTPYEQSRGWNDGHDLMFRCLIRAVNARSTRLLHIAVAGWNRFTL
ncbi:hypothetical protein MMC22_005064 [Lobaria immixta]|nr:hypothetical protein [Lobaria immixta]